jgi:hypothetical protein
MALNFIGSDLIRCGISYAKKNYDIFIFGPFGLQGRRAPGLSFLSRQSSHVRILLRASTNSQPGQIDEDYVRVCERREKLPP